MIEPEKAKGHVVFDCDGTLISSYEGVILSLMDFWSQVLGRDIDKSEMKEKYYPQLDIMAKNFGLEDLAPERQKELMGEWATVCSRQDHKYSLFEEIMPLLEACHQEDWSLYVWTGRDRGSTLEILKALGIMPFFWDLRTASDGIPKPHPMGMEELVGQWEKEKIVLIGDSQADLQGAKNFGCHFLGATWCDHSDKRNLQNGHWAQTPLECLEKLKSIIKE